MYRAPPEVNRICVRKARDRAYQKHLNALKNVKPSIDTRQPLAPNSIGKNFKRYEIEKQRNLAIQNQNVRLVHRLDKILREEHYCAQPPGRPHTLQGRFQKEQMLRITEENAKIVKAIQQSRPLLNRNDWYMHRLDHQYQLHKNAEYKQTLPMSEIIQIDEQEQSARRQSYKKDDDFANIYPPKPPSTARPEYRPSRNSIQNEEQYQVHEPPPRPATDDKRYDVEDSENHHSLHNQIEDHLKDEFGQEKPQNDDQDFSLSLKHEIEDEAIKVDDSLEIQNENESKDTNMSLSFKDEIRDNINEENLEANGKDDTKDESFSIKPQINDEKLEANGVDDTPEENHEENNESESKDQNLGGFSIKPQINNDKLEANGVDDTPEEVHEENNKTETKGENLGGFSIKPQINDEKLEANGVDDTPEENHEENTKSETKDQNLGGLSTKPQINDQNLEANGVDDTPEEVHEENNKTETKGENLGGLSIKPQINDEKLEANGVDDTPEENHDEKANSETNIQNSGTLSIKPHIDNDKLEANGVDDTKDEGLSLKLHINSGNLEANGVDDTPDEPKQDNKISELHLGEKSVLGAVENLNKDKEQKGGSPMLGLGGLVNSAVKDGLQEKKTADNSLSHALLH